MSSEPAGQRASMDAAARHFRAPGRINIIGEHTDYNDGFVLPTNTALFTNIVATPRDDSLIRVVTHSLDEQGEFRIDGFAIDGSPQWLNYVQGVAAELMTAGAPLIGADLVIDSDIPIGGGLSSSASLELAVARALTALAGIEIDARILANACQQAEINFAGVSCGIMDQYSVACGQPGAAMLLDCKSLQTQFARLPENMSLVVTDSGVEHRHPDSGYNDRADESRAVVHALQKSGANIRSLRDVSLDILEAEKRELGDRLFRRARHVVTENERTLAAFVALQEGDFGKVGSLVRGSHASLRDDYEVSCDGIEVLVDLVSRCEGVAGSRMVGGGFGGCVLSVVEKTATDSVVERIRTEYGKVLGSTPWVHVVAPAEAAREIDL